MVVEEGLVVEVVGATVVDVDVVVGAVVVVVVVVVREQPATRPIRQTITKTRLTAADPEGRMSLLAMGTAPRAQAHGTVQTDTHVQV